MAENDGQSKKIVKIVGDEVTLRATNETGFIVIFDTQPPTVRLLADIIAKINTYVILLLHADQ